MGEAKNKDKLNNPNPIPSHSPIRRLVTNKIILNTIVLTGSRNFIFLKKSDKTMINRLMIAVIMMKLRFPCRQPPFHI